MAKIKVIVFIIFCVSGFVSLFGQNSRDRVVNTYIKEIGVRELSGRNDGERVEMYIKSVGHKKGAPWCAAFVSWVFHESEVTAVRSAWSPSWFPAERTIYIRGASSNKVPEAADVFGIYFQNLKRIAHVGFVHEWQLKSSFLITVEGNTNDSGSRDGDGVYKKRRLKNQIYKISRWL